jgi:hypothetical protein
LRGAAERQQAALRLRTAAASGPGPKACLSVPNLSAWREESVYCRNNAAGPRITPLTPPAKSPLDRFYLRILSCGVGILLLLAGGVASTQGYSFHGYSWPLGTQIVMHLQLSRTVVPLQDGSASWNASAADALAIWNQYLDTVQFAEDTPASAAADDHISTVFFSKNVYGMTWPTGTLAVTLYFSPSGSYFTETDILFNDNLKWNSYRGPQQGSGPTGTWDLHRVALHELGHVIGLDHPDEYGQNVEAIMNSIVSNLDHLSDDDIAGARALYAAKITSSLFPSSGSVDSSFSYRITANNNPTGFAATGLPPGLQLDTTTGFMTGAPAAAGSFDVAVTAYGSRVNVSATVRITIQGPVITSSTSPIGVSVGNGFSYQITASKNSTSYAATGLPPGLELDPNTGLITGVPTISGTYSVTVFARGSFGEATARITMTFSPNPLPAAYDKPSFTLPVGKGPIVTDSVRSRVYVCDGSSIAVVNTAPPGVIGTIPISGPYTVTTLALSRDNKTLWFIRSVGTIGRIDLETLQILPDFSTSEFVRGLQEGLDNRLYGASSNGGVVQLDATTGAVQGRFVTSAPFAGGGNQCSVQISPDGKVLYVDVPSGPGFQTFDVSGASPVLLQSSQPAGIYGYMSLSPDGTRFSFWTGSGVTLFDTADIGHPLGQLPSPYYAYLEAIFARDNSLLFQLATPTPTDPRLLVYSSTARQLVRTITLPPRSNGYRYLGVDASNTYVMACPADTTGGTAALVFYPIVPQSATVAPHSLLNVSTRMRAEGGDNALIGGFIISGQDPKQIAVRAMGPSLPVAGKLADPVLQLFDGTGALVAQNDNWNSHRADVIATGVPPSDEHEAVIAATLPPGSYTGVVRGVNNTAGVALIEAYDLSGTSNSKLANISTRGKVDAGDNVMIGGFILGGDQATKVVVRAIGPSLANFGVFGALTDPILEVHDGNGGLLAQDDDWRSSQEQVIAATGLAPSDDRESAIMLVLQPGPYTAIVRGKSNGIGVGLVEVYNLDAN